MRRGGHHLLEVVEQQEQSAIAQIGLEEISGGLVAHLEETQGLSNRRDDELRVADRGEGDKADTVGELVGKIRGDLEREPGLADAAGTSQGQQRTASRCRRSRTAAASRSRPMSGVSEAGREMAWSLG